MLSQNDRPKVIPVSGDDHFINNCKFMIVAIPAVGTSHHRRIMAGRQWRGVTVSGISAWNDNIFCKATGRTIF